MSATVAAIPGKTLKYDSKTIMLHWLTAGLVVVLWLSAQILDAFGHGASLMYMISLHATLGIVLALVVAARVGWRLTNGRSLPDADNGWMEVVARATHYGLYLLVGGTILLGVLTVWARGQEIWGLFTLPTLDPSAPDVRHRLTGIHGLLANLILILAGAHAAAALFHHYILRDGVLHRMLPPRVSRWIG